MEERALDPSSPGVRFLLDSPDPSIRLLTLTEVLGRSERSAEVRELRRRLVHGPRLGALLAGAGPDGSFGVHWYKKWAGATWRLVSAVELGVPPDHPVAQRALRYVLDRLPHRTADPHRVRGRFRVHASVLGNPLGVSARLGRATDPRVRAIAHGLVRWQWPDGGWNCDSAPDATHSSFYESLATLWGLSEYLRTSGDDSVRPAVERAAEFFLRHRLVRSCRGEGELPSEWSRLHYPVYWHYDLLQALRVLGTAGALGDPRTREALDRLLARRSPDGSWAAERRFWRSGPADGANTEVVDWGVGPRNEMVTLNALRVLRAAGRRADAGTFRRA